MSFGNIQWKTEYICPNDHVIEVVLKIYTAYNKVYL